MATAVVIQKYWILATGQFYHRLKGHFPKATLNCLIIGDNLINQPAMVFRLSTIPPIAHHYNTELSRGYYTHKHNNFPCSQTNKTLIGITMT